MKDDWVRAALTDDTVVVELLFRLRKSSSSEPSSKRPLSVPLPPQKWGLRQTRSKPVTMMRKESATTTTTNTRFSPTTPLSSWSGGSTSPSDGGSDESSRFPSDPSSAVRSKAFSELKEEDSSLLLKERQRLHSKKELVLKRTTLSELSAWSHNTKRMKVDLDVQSTSFLGAKLEDATVSKQQNQIEPSSTSKRQHSPSRELASPSSSKLKDEETSSKGGFVLPDLNMPVEEETN